jgi:DNA gyrase inhibitor GyrI
VSIESVELDDIRVMFMRADEDSGAAIQKAWAEFEHAVGLKGRKFYGAFYPEASEYRVCTQFEADDSPESLGFGVATLPGGTFLRVRLKGEPPGIYAKIGPTFEQLAKDPRADASRPSIEFYRSRDVIDLFLPIT